MNTLIYYQDSRTKDGRAGAIENCPIEAKRNFFLWFPNGLGYTRRYEGRIEGAERLIAFMKDVKEFFRGNYRVRMTVGEVGVRSEGIELQCYTAMDIEIAGDNENGEKGSFDMIVRGEVGEQLSDLREMIRQGGQTA